MEPKVGEVWTVLNDKMPDAVWHYQVVAVFSDRAGNKFFSCVKQNGDGPWPMLFNADGDDATGISPEYYLSGKTRRRQIFAPEGQTPAA